MRRKGDARNHVSDILEVMACPSGCVNGGGQIRFNNSNANDGSSTSMVELPSVVNKRVQNVNEILHDSVVRRPLGENPLIQYIYQDGVLGAPMGERARQMLHTRYHAVPKLEVVAPLATKW